MKRVFRSVKELFAVAVATITLLFLCGCSVEENPITPEKMQEIRKQEANERANFNPSTSSPGQSSR